MKTWQKILLGLIVAGVIVVASLPRGIRNKNPGNLRHSRDDWEGLRETQTDDAFFQFKESVFGIRALAKTLISYRKRHGITTIRGIIERYAPGVENDTESYIASVSRKTGIEADKNIVIDAALDLLIPAIIQHENGINPYPDKLIADAITRAKA